MIPTTYSRDELSGILGAVGEDVSVHRSVLFSSPSRIQIGSHVRIDCFSLLEAVNHEIIIGDYVHLAAGVCLLGVGGPIEIASFAGLSARTVVTTSNQGAAGQVLIGRHVLIGAGSVILPGVTLGMGASVGSLSVVTAPVGEFLIVAGNPARTLGKRDRILLEREKNFLGES